MPERRQLVARLRQIMEEAVPLAPVRDHAPLTGAEMDARRRNAAIFPIRRANSLREISRLSRWYGWEGEIDQALARAGVLALKYLDADDLEALLGRLHVLVDALHAGCDLADAPPAR